MTDTNAQITGKAIDTLLDALHNNEVKPSNVSAAKVLLENFAPKKTDEEQKNEALERDSAIAEANGLLTEFATLKFTLFSLQTAVAEACTAPTDNAAGKLANLADFSRAWLGKDENGS